ncbi:Potassium channel KOR1 [Acorus gramineus]|uniref:Potassium channel n=1 Tax=Acorus gramineus TaxID=55184 RepID=A0AAV9AHU4_ACOGR|nr:Potassium channel KOR1 [Acorus gramineus]
MTPRGLEMTKREKKEIELEVEAIDDGIGSSRESRFDLINGELIGVLPKWRWRSRERVLHGLKRLPRRFIVNPENNKCEFFNLTKMFVWEGNGSRLYEAWTQFILLWAVYSSFFTPLEFGFFRGLPKNLFLLDFAGQLAFLADIVLHFRLAYRDSHTYRMVDQPSLIARRDIDIWKRYLTSLYFAIVTMATVGYGDIHAVNLREMVFVMIYVSFDMILGAYLIGNMTALIVKGSKTERFRDKMKDLIKYMNRNRLEKDIRDQIKGHVRLQYESSYTDASVLQDIPVSIRAKISQSLYRPDIEKVPLFKGCSAEFINQIEGVGVGEDGSEETVLRMEPNCTFGEIAVLCNIPQPYTVRVCELCRLLRIDKQSFTNILEIYFFDGRTIMSNLLEERESNLQIKQLESDITFHIGKQEAELALKVNSAAYHGDLNHLKGLVRAGADPNKTDYDGRTPLHLAASRGYEDVCLFLIQEGVTINSSDKFGNTPVLEAIENGHDRIASLLVKKGASLSIEDAGSRLCSAIARGDSDFLKRVLTFGIDPNAKDYDHRTPLHIAAAEGLWGNTPMDEGRRSGSKPLIRLLESAKASELLEFPNRSEDIPDKMHPRRCTVFPFHPWDPKEKRREGVMLWIPRYLEDLIESSNEQLKCNGTKILSEEGGRITDVDMISDGQKVYLTSDGETS